MEEETSLVPMEQPKSIMAQIEQSRAVQEVQAALIIAKKFPRDTTAAFQKITESCKRISLAEKAMYSYPRGGQVVTGPSIRLAEVLAQSYGNLDFGVRELERRGSVSIAESYCWDMESNVRQTKTFEVPHEIGLKGGKKKVLSDPRDIYELVANQGSRRLRACILGIIPVDIQEAAVLQIKATLKKGNGEPLIDRVRKMVVAFKDLGVAQEMIEEKLGHKVDLITADEFVDLTAIWTSLRDKQAKISDFFNYEEPEERKKSKLADKIKENTEAANEAKT